MNGRRIFERQKDIATKILRKIKYKNVFKILYTDIQRHALT